MALQDAVTKAIATAEQLRESGSANEANTKHHVIEPVLSALGWHLDDFSEVDREYKVYDGTFLDYALRTDGRPRLFIEAKALGKSLADKQFIAQTVNYANNEGVVWCVLTNGLVYQAYKSNEPVAMERKLLFEVDLRDAADKGDLSSAATSLSALSRSAVVAGELDQWGEIVFTDMRVRTALAALATDVDSSLVAVVSDAVEGQTLTEGQLRRSLVRILGDLAKAQGEVHLPPVEIPGNGPTGQGPVPLSGTGRKPHGTKSYSIDGHTRKMPSGIIDLFQHVDSYASSLGPDVSRRVTKMYIGYFAGKRSFFTLQLTKSKINVYLSLLPSEVQPWQDSEMRDVRNVGHYGMGETEFALHQPDQLERLNGFLKLSYLRNRR